MPREPMLEVTGLKSSYGATPILTGVDLSISKGEIVALIGRNGVGKTTTMRCLIGLLRASGGTIRVYARGWPRRLSGRGQRTVQVSCPAQPSAEQPPG